MHLLKQTQMTLQRQTIYPSFWEEIFDLTQNQTSKFDDCDCAPILNVVVSLQPKYHSDLPYHLIKQICYRLIIKTSESRHLALVIHSIAFLKSYHCIEECQTTCLELSLNERVSEFELININQVLPAMKIFHLDSQIVNLMIEHFYKNNGQENFFVKLEIFQISQLLGQLPSNEVCQSILSNVYNFINDLLLSTDSVNRMNVNEMMYLIWYLSFTTISPINSGSNNSNLLKQLSQCYVCELESVQLKGISEVINTTATLRAKHCLAEYLKVCEFLASSESNHRFDRKSVNRIVFGMAGFHLHLPLFELILNHYSHDMVKFNSIHWDTQSKSILFDDRNDLHSRKLILSNATLSAIRSTYVNLKKSKEITNLTISAQSIDQPVTVFSAHHSNFDKRNINVFWRHLLNLSRIPQSALISKEETLLITDSILDNNENFNDSTNESVKIPRLSIVDQNKNSNFLIAQCQLNEAQLRILLTVTRNLVPHFDCTDCDHIIKFLESSKFDSHRKRLLNPSFKYVQKHFSESLQIRRNKTQSSAENAVSFNSSRYYPPNHS